MLNVSALLRGVRRLAVIHAVSIFLDFLSGELVLVACMTRAELLTKVLNLFDRHHCFQVVGVEPCLGGEAWLAGYIRRFAMDPTSDSCKLA